MYTYVYIYTYMYTYVYIYTYLYVYIYIFIYVYMHIYTCMNMYIIVRGGELVLKIANSTREISIETRRFAVCESFCITIREGDLIFALVDNFFGEDLPEICRLRKICIYTHTCIPCVYDV